MAPKNGIDSEMISKSDSAYIAETQSLIEEVITNPGDISKAHKLYEKYSGFKKRVGDVLEQDKNSSINSLTKNIESFCETYFSSIAESAIEENKAHLDTIEQSLLVDGFFRLNIAFVQSIFKKLEKSGVKEFDKFIENVIKSEIADIFERNRNKIKEQIVRDTNYSELEENKVFFDNLEHEGYIKEDFFEETKQALLDKYLESAFPELKKKIDEIFTWIDEGIEKNYIVTINPEKVLDNFKSHVQEIRDKIESGTDIEEELKKITEEFEINLFKKISKLYETYFEKVIKIKVDEYDSRADFDKYEKSPEFNAWLKDIDFIVDKQFELIIEDKNLKNTKKNREETKEFYLKNYNNLKREILLKNAGKIVKIKKKGDLVNFGDVSFPVYQREKQTSVWKIDPKVDKDSVVINFKESKSGLQIRPSENRKLFKNFELPKEEYKEIINNFEKIRKTEDYEALFSEKKELMAKLGELRKENKVSLDDENNVPEIVEIKKNLKEIKAKLKDAIPHIFKILEVLNRFKYGEIPSLSDKIKITPYILDNLKKVISLASDQLIRQDGIGILEGEAGVGKNVLIDIFAYYTNRPVFKFACNARTSKEELTYLWLIDKDGTYKLHSKVYEAIKTPGAILILDEINTLPPDVLKLLNGLFDYNRTLTMPYDNEHIKAHPDVIIFGTQNPTHYLGTKPLPQDTGSRANPEIINYPILDGEKEGTHFVHFDEGLITYANMPYYHKLLDVKGYNEDDIKKFFSLKLKQKSNFELLEEEQEFVDKIEANIMTEQEFVDAWNNIYNFPKKEELKQSHGDLFVEGIEDIHTLIKLANVIRKRYKDKMEGTNRTDFITVSVSQRDLNKMMGKLCEGAEPKQAFLDCYTSLIPDIGVRAKVIKEFQSLNI
ncbi:AAA family ATPase [Candidatus Gracilibacteria bacterium]|nr:AAA family ATPase [Candidatus Gracilibacteria bacterium]